MLIQDLFYLGYFIANELSNNDSVIPFDEITEETKYILETKKYVKANKVTTAGLEVFSTWFSIALAQYSFDEYHSLVKLVKDLPPIEVNEVLLLTHKRSRTLSRREVKLSFSTRLGNLIINGYIAELDNGNYSLTKNAHLLTQVCSLLKSDPNKTVMAKMLAS